MMLQRLRSAFFSLYIHEIFVWFLSSVLLSLKLNMITLDLRPVVTLFMSHHNLGLELLSAVV
jgi:hypothetical protein